MGIVPILALAALILAIGLTIMQGSTPVSAAYAKFYLDCPTTEVREGEDVDVFLVMVTNFQHNPTFGAYWHTDAGTAGTSDYVHQDTGAIWSTNSERLAGRAKHTFETREDSLIEGNETFTARFSPVDNVVDRNDPDRDEKCEITIIDDDPNITDVEVTSSPARDETYGVGETIEITATFSTDVEVDGNPALGLLVGSNSRSADYLSGSGTDSLVFGYTVGASDSDADGISMDGGYEDSDGVWHNFSSHTAVTAVGTDTVAYREYSGIDDQSGHKVDGGLTPVGTEIEITSNPAGGDTYRYGETVEIALTLSSPVDVEGSKHLNARVGTGGDNWRAATYKSGTGTDTLVFGYTVQTSDLDADGFSVEGSHLDDGVVEGWGGSGTIKVKGTDIVVPPNFTGISNESGHKINGQPYAKTISITSTPVSRSDTYGRGEDIQVSVDFGQSVTASDEAIVILFMGSYTSQRNATYASGNGTDTLAFEYTVVEEDRDENGVAAYVPDGLDIKATGTGVRYQADPGGETPEMPENPNHKVDGSLVTADTTPPIISSICFADFPGTGDDDTYGAGDFVAVRVTFSEGVLATGNPKVELDVGGTARMAEYRHLSRTALNHTEVQGVANATLVFGYTVQEGDSDNDGLSIGADRVRLNGGTIRDEANNNAVLTHNAVEDDSGHKVDAPDVTAPAVSTVSITSDPGDDHTYAVGDTIEVTVTFSEDVMVDVSGTMHIEIDVGGTARNASYSSTDGADVVFSYTVASGDSDSDGVSIGANKLDLNDATIRDGADNDATVTHDAVAADDGHLVDAVGPTVSLVSITSDPGEDATYGNGDAIEVTVTFSENVTVTGVPHLEIDVGGTPRTAAYSSASGAMVIFSYTVSVGDTDSDGISIGADKLTLNGGAIDDAQGNEAAITHIAVDTDEGHKVSAPGGL